MSVSTSSSEDESDNDMRPTPSNMRIGTPFATLKKKSSKDDMTGNKKSLKGFTKTRVLSAQAAAASKALQHRRSLSDEVFSWAMGGFAPNKDHDTAVLIDWKPRSAALREEPNARNKRYKAGEPARAATPTAPESEGSLATRNEPRTTSHLTTPERATGSSPATELTSSSSANSTPVYNAPKDVRGEASSRRARASATTSKPARGAIESETNPPPPLASEASPSQTAKAMSPSNPKNDLVRQGMRAKSPQTRAIPWFDYIPVVQATLAKLKEREQSGERMTREVVFRCCDEAAEEHCFEAGLEYHSRRLVSYSKHPPDVDDLEVGIHVVEKIGGSGKCPNIWKSVGGNPPTDSFHGHRYQRLDGMHARYYEIYGDTFHLLVIEISPLMSYTATRLTNMFHVLPIKLARIIVAAVTPEVANEFMNLSLNDFQTFMNSVVNHLVATAGSGKWQDQPLRVICETLRGDVETDENGESTWHPHRAAAR